MDGEALRAIQAPLKDRYRGEPQFLQFLAPGLNQVFEGYYLPHLTRVNEALKSILSLGYIIEKKG